MALSPSAKEQKSSFSDLQCSQVFIFKVKLREKIVRGKSIRFSKDHYFISLINQQIRIGWNVFTT